MSDTPKDRRQASWDAAARAYEAGWTVTACATHYFQMKPNALVCLMSMWHDNSCKPVLMRLSPVVET